MSQLCDSPKGSPHSAQYEFSFTLDQRVRTRVCMGRGVLKEIPRLLNESDVGRVVIVSDEIVGPLYANPLAHLLVQTGISVNLSLVSPGESSKTWLMLEKLYDDLTQFKVGRDGIIIAVGGGTVGDLAGVVAATYLRGLRFITVPTTVVSMSTAAIGGKAAINWRNKKNVIGVFKHPESVVIDFDALQTLPQEEFRSGFGELVSIGVLGEPLILDLIETDGKNALETLILRAVRFKIRIVQKDPFDTLGLRATLNLGHTFGHAFEVLSNYRIAHGIAVGVGTYIAAAVSAKLGLCHATLPSRVRRLLEQLGLPTRLEGLDPEEVLYKMREDKKSRNDKFCLVLPLRPGKVTLISQDQVPEGLLNEVLDQVLG